MILFKWTKVRLKILISCFQIIHWLYFCIVKLKLKRALLWSNPSSPQNIFFEFFHNSFQVPRSCSHKGIYLYAFLTRKIVLRHTKISFQLSDYWLYYRSCSAFFTFHLFLILTILYFWRRWNYDFHTSDLRFSFPPSVISQFFRKL